MTITAIFGIGFIAGIITGQIGASGVMVIVPGLIMLGYSTFDAIGVSLFVDTVASLTVAWTYYNHGNVNLKQGWWVALGSVLGAQIGSFVSPSIPEVGLSNSFGVFLILTALIFWRPRNKAMIQNVQDPSTNQKTGNKLLSILRTNVTISSTIMGLVIGIITGVLGAGGGVMILLVLVFLMDYKIHAGIGTSTLVMAFTAASGAIGHALTGNLPLDAAVCGALGALVGGRISARLANKVSEAILTKIVGTIFAVLGVVMLVGS